MEAKHITVATKELNKARACLEEMPLQISAAYIAGFQENWSRFLIHINRTYNKIMHGSRFGPAKGWFDQIKHNIKHDQLLSYIDQARNVEEHGIEEVILEVKPQAFSIGMSMGQSVVSSFIKQTPHALALVPLKNRGVVYNVPKEHLSKPIQSKSIINAAQLTLVYYQGIVKGAEYYVGKR